MTDVIQPPKGEVIESVLIGGDLARLNPHQKLNYYKSVCESVGLNPLTKPFAYIRLNGREVLYATRDATDQLRRRYNVSIKIQSREVINGVFVVTAQASIPDGRTDESVGAVFVDGAHGEVLANLMMKAETKAKRRVTLSICGLGMLDETEVESIPEARQDLQRRRAAPAPKESQPEIPSGFDTKESHEKALFLLEETAREYGWGKEDVVRIVGTQFGLESIRELSWAQFNEYLKYIKKHPVDENTIKFS